MLAIVLALAAPLPAHYAKLFVDGTAWTYDVTLTTWDAKLGDIDTSKVPMKKWPRHTERSTVDCRVAKVATIGSAQIAKIECGAADQKFQVAGVYVATAAGLHRFSDGDMPATAEDLANLEPPLIAAKPKPAARTKREPFVDNQFFTVTTTIRLVGGAWCTAQTIRGAAHDGTRRTCFGGGLIASGSDDFGGELHDFQFRVRK